MTITHIDGRHTIRQRSRPSYSFTRIRKIYELNKQPSELTPPHSVHRFEGFCKFRVLILVRAKVVVRSGRQTVSNRCKWLPSVVGFVETESAYFDLDISMRQTPALHRLNFEFLRVVLRCLLQALQLTHVVTGKTFNPLNVHQILMR